MLDTATTLKFAKMIAATPDLVSLTFEGNTIQDEAAVASLFQNLKTFDKIENLNIRQNMLTIRVVEALCEGITHKKELRVSLYFHLTKCCRLWTWGRTRLTT